MSFIAQQRFEPATQFKLLSTKPCQELLINSTPKRYFSVLATKKNPECIPQLLFSQPSRNCYNLQSSRKLFLSITTAVQPFACMSNEVQSPPKSDFSKLWELDGVHYYLRSQERAINVLLCILELLIRSWSGTTTTTHTPRSFLGEKKKNRCRTHTNKPIWVQQIVLNRQIRRVGTRIDGTREQTSLGRHTETDAPP